jgi:hypothetical protein
MASILTIGVGVAAAAFLVRLHPIYSIIDTDSFTGQSRFGCITAVAGGSRSIRESILQGRI